MEIIKKGFKLSEDGSILAGYGTSHHGIAQIKVWIEGIKEDGIKFIVSSEEIQHIHAHIGHDLVTGVNIQPSFQSAIFSGAEETYLQSAATTGIEFTLISALVHPVDANEMYFKYAGKIAIAAWYQLQSNPAETCLIIMNFSNCAHIYSSHLMMMNRF
jgi:hypothetical protein